MEPSKWCNQMHEATWPKREKQTLTVVRSLRVTCFIKSIGVQNLSIGRQALAAVESKVTPTKSLVLVGVKVDFFEADTDSQGRQQAEQEYGHQLDFPDGSAHQEPVIKVWKNSKSCFFSLKLQPLKKISVKDPGYHIQLKWEDSELVMVLPKEEPEEPSVGQVHVYVKLTVFHVKSHKLCVLFQRGNF